MVGGICTETASKSEAEEPGGLAAAPRRRPIVHAEYQPAAHRAPEPAGAAGGAGAGWPGGVRPAQHGILHLRLLPGVAIRCTCAAGCASMSVRVVHR